jgi:hypothetical protein
MPGLPGIHENLSDPGALYLDGRVKPGPNEAGSQQLAGVQDHCGIFAVGHAELFGAFEPRERDLAWRCFPRLGMGFLPAEMPLARTGVERGPLVVADPEQGSDAAAIGHHEPPVRISG